MRPLVTVMMPCFNAADTIPMALASLRAQSLTDWECVCIDDGSSDATWSVLEGEAATEPRLRIERFASNRGRGAARERALRAATGKYLAFLDSDDWMYPERLRHEVEWLERDATISAVSVCAAVTNGPRDLVGVMRPRPPNGLPQVISFDHPRPPYLMFPPSMIRTDLAQATGFDPAFRRSQDSDFLIRALLGKRYALSDAVLYAYSQGTAASLDRTLEGYKYRMRAHARHWRTHPAHVGATILQTLVKMGVYAVAGRLGRDRALIERRWQPADPASARAFHEALETVISHLAPRAA